MALIVQVNKKNGRRYVYENYPKWDPEKKCSVAKRKLIGYYDEVTGELVKTRGRAENGAGRQKKTATKTLKKTVILSDETPTNTETKSIGLTYFLNQIALKLDIVTILKKYFPYQWKKILSLAIYRLSENENSTYRFNSFNHESIHPYGEDISPSAASALFENITETSINNFFKEQILNYNEESYVLYDSNFKNSFNEGIDLDEWNTAKKWNRLDQINIFSLFGETSKLPCLYSVKSENISDTITVQALIDNLKMLGINKVKLVFNADFYSAANLKFCYKNNIEYLINVKLNIAYIKDAVINSIKDLKNPLNFLRDHNGNIIGTRITIKNPEISDKLNYLYIYKNLDTAHNKEVIFLNKINQLYKELTSGKTKTSHTSAYNKFFIKKNSKYFINDDAIEKTKMMFGIFALVGSSKQDVGVALNIYRQKDYVNKGFCNLKGSLDMHRLIEDTNETLNGKVFITYISFIIISYIYNVMNHNMLFEKYTLNELFDTLKRVIAKVDKKGDISQIILQKRHVEIYQAFGINTPTDGI